MTTRHEFLDQLHDLIKPKKYLEVGVQHGWSLQLARPETLAIGVDPMPLIQSASPNVLIYATSSDNFFALQEVVSFGDPIDFAFIDGMHLYEFALRDFFNIERLSHDRTVVVFDDVLPRNSEEATRVQQTHDWTGDVWKVIEVLEELRPDLGLLQVDTAPTGTLVVFSLNPTHYRELPEIPEIIGEVVPSYILDREDAISASYALDIIRTFIA